MRIPNRGPRYEFFNAFRCCSRWRRRSGLKAAAVLSSLQLPRAKLVRSARLRARMAYGGNANLESDLNATPYSVESPLRLATSPVSLATCRRTCGMTIMCGAIPSSTVAATCRVRIQIGGVFMDLSYRAPVTSEYGLTVLCGCLNLALVRVSTTRRPAPAHVTRFEFGAGTRVASALVSTASRTSAGRAQREGPFQRSSGLA